MTLRRYFVNRFRNVYCRCGRCFQRAISNWRFMLPPGPWTLAAKRRPSLRMRMTPFHRTMPVRFP